MAKPSVRQDLNGQQKLTKKNNFNLCTQILAALSPCACLFDCFHVIAGVALTGTTRVGENVVS